MSIPTKGETFSILIMHLAKAQEAAALMAHLSRDDSTVKADGWLAISELFKKVQHKVTDLATRGLQ